MSFGSLLLTFTPAILASAAFTTSALFSFWCDSIQFELLDDADADLFADSLHFGPWYQKKTSYVDAPGDGDYVVQEQSCVEWTTDANTDGSLKTVRAFGIIVGVVGGLLTVVLWLRPCLAGYVSQSTWRTIALVFLLFVMPMQALMFLLFHSNACAANPVVALLERDFNRDLYDAECSWDQASTANVFSVFLWLATAVAMLVMGAPQRPPPSPPETQEVTYQRTTLPDGTTAVQEGAVVKGTAVPPPEKA